MGAGCSPPLTQPDDSVKAHERRGQSPTMLSKLSRSAVRLASGVVWALGCAPSVLLPTADGGSSPVEERGVDPALDAPATTGDAGRSEGGVATDAGGDGSVTRDLGATLDVSAAHGCVPTVATGREDTNELCANGLDDDCNGYADCVDFRCSRNANAVTVCQPDAGPAAVDAPPAVDVPPSTMDAGLVGPTGGTVSRLRFAVFGDVRPPSPNATTAYPTAIITAVLDGVTAAGAQFAVASGDYMFATTGASADAQVTMLLAAESRFRGHVFHSMGNHECTGASASNCPLGSETAQIRVYRTRLAPAYATPYFDWVITTDLGDAHFIATAPNAWSASQQAWLDRALARPALYTIVIAHEPPGDRQAPGSVAIESAVSARAGGVTLRLYGHTHEYRHLLGNAIIAGNAGAPLASATGQYGYVVVDQRADGDLVVTAYTIGRPAMVADSFVLTPGGALTR